MTVIYTHTHIRTYAHETKRMLSTYYKHTHTHTRTTKQKTHSLHIIVGSKFKDSSKIVIELQPN